MSTESRLDRAVPAPIAPQQVPLPVIGITLVVSIVAGIYGFSLASAPLGDQLWIPVLFTILPWLPVFFFEAVWKYEYYGFYALMQLFVILQLGHLGEHTAQVLQLLFSGGDATVSHGVFGVFDRELVHFVWDSLVWIGLITLVIKLGPRNKWLLIALVAASFHEVEHVFLYYLSRFHADFYNAGGTTGIFAKGGLIGSPFPRPYLHFGYNYLVVTPLCIAFWDETRRAYNLFLARALPSLTASEKASASGMLEKVGYEAGETIIRQGDRADRFYVVGEGEVEVVREGDGGEERLAVLTEGHFFGEIGLLTGMPRTATVRAHTDVDVFVLEADEFLNLITRSRGAQADVDSEIAERVVELREHNVDVSGITGEMATSPQTPPALPAAAASAAENGSAPAATGTARATAAPPAQRKASPQRKAPAARKAAATRPAQRSAPARKATAPPRKGTTSTARKSTAAAARKGTAAAAKPAARKAASTGRKATATASSTGRKATSTARKTTATARKKTSAARETTPTGKTTAAAKTTRRSKAS
jgi:CRP-like cAMP-binding protein